MTYVHERSGDCAKAELDLFEAPLTQTSLERADWTAYPPSATITNTTVDFRVPGTGDEYIDLMNSFLALKVKITNADGSHLTGDANVGPVNCFPHSLFSQVEVQLNGHTIGHANSLYPYRAMIEKLINYGPEAAQSHLQTELFYKDTAGYMESAETRLSNHLELVRGFHESIPLVVNVPDTAQAFVEVPELGNQGLYLRSLYTRNSQVVELVAPIHHDVFQHDRLLINNVSLSISFTRTKPEFSLMTSALSPAYKIDIVEALLFIRKVRVADHVQLAHHAALMKSNCIYPINHVVMKSFSIPRGNLSLGQDSIFMGTLPQEMVVVFVNSISAAGSFMRNPFNFQHMNIQRMVCKYAGVPVPSQPLSLSFRDNDPGGGQFTRALHMLYACTGKLNQDKGCLIERQDFPRGYALYAFNFRPDFDSRGYYSLKRQGVVQLEVEFREPLAETITMIVMASFDSYFEITRAREVISASI